MADTVLFEVPMPFDTESEFSAFLISGAASKIFMAFTIDGLTFYVSDQGFNLQTVGGAPRVYPVVVSWGPFRKFMSRDGRDRQNEVDIDFDPQGVIVDSTGTTQRTFMQLLQEFQLRESPVSFYQWSEVATTDFLLWTGFWQNFHSYRTEKGKPLISVRFGSRESDLENPVSDVVNRTDFPAAAVDSIDKMVPRNYGSLQTKINPTADTPPIGALFGSFGHRFVEGVVVDEQQTQLKTKVRFAKNDGIQPAHSMTQNLSFCIFIPEANTYAILDDVSLAMTNDTAEVAIVVALDPFAFIAHRLGSKGSKSKAAFDASLWKIGDNDPTNYIETTSTDYEIALEIPSLTISGLQVSYITPFVHATSPVVFPTTRTFRVGVWNDFNTGSAGFLGNTGKTSPAQTVHSTQPLCLLPFVNYYAADFKTNVGSNTVAEFQSGTFVGRDSSDNATPLQLYFYVDSASKDQVRLHSLGVVVYGKLGVSKQTRVTRSSTRKRKFDIQGRFIGWETVPVTVSTEETSIDQRRLTYLCQGIFQKDAVGTYDTAGGPIRKGASIAHHLLEKIGGESINNVPGTVGNFSDAKTEETAGEKSLDPVFGPDVITMGDAIASLQANHPIRLHKEDGVWQCVYEEMNPNSSRWYRSTAEVVSISAKRHLVGDSIRVEELAWNLIRNEANISYGHSFGTTRALGIINVKNKLSQDLFGVRKIPAPIEAPWITAESLDPTVTNYPARFLGQYYTRVNGRPRLTVTCRLSQEFFDLKRGHVVEFDTDMEDVGIQCPAFRCGYFDYAFQRTDAATTNQAMSDTPTLMPNGAVTSRTVFAASQQPSGITIVHNGVGTYTTVANGWKYFDGSSWVSLSNVTRSDAGDPLAAFKGAAGSYTVNWDRPSPWLWKKGAPAITGVDVGYSYFFGMDYTGTNSGGTVVGTARSSHLARWYGRLFEAIEVTRKPGAEGDYPYVEAVFQEVM